MAFNATVNNTLESWHLHLQLNTSDPDLLGFANVGGFYGPGTWAGWFLTVCASWYTLLIHGGRGFDPNTWLYLAGLNWAAIDLLRHLHNSKTSLQAHDNTWMKDSAAIGAAFNVVWWGLCHSLAQLAVCRKSLLSATLADKQRVLTLTFGSIVPAAVLTTPTWMEIGWPWVHVPAIYWNGMLAIDDSYTTRVRGYLDFSHHSALFLASALGLWSVIFFGCLALVFCREVLYSVAPKTMENVEAFIIEMIETLKGLVAVLCFPWRVLRRRVPRKYFWLAIITIYIGFVILIARKNLGVLLTFATMPLLVPVFLLKFLVQPVITAQHFFTLSCAYTFKAYLGLGSSPFQSCFFMPCAPQSITEMDQAFALFVAIFSFFVVEIAVPVVYQNRVKQKEQLLDMEMARYDNMVSRTTAPVVHHAPPPLAHGDNP